MAAGRTASRIALLAFVAILLAAAAQPGGVGAWFGAKFLNREQEAAPRPQGRRQRSDATRRAGGE